MSRLFEYLHKMHVRPAATNTNMEAGGRSLIYGEFTPNLKANCQTIHHLWYCDPIHARLKTLLVFFSLEGMVALIDKLSKCNAIHKTIVEQFKYAIVYGKSVKHQPQRVGLTHELADEDISEWVSLLSRAHFLKGITVTIVKR